MNRLIDKQIAVISMIVTLVTAGVSSSSSTTKSSTIDAIGAPMASDGEGAVALDGVLTVCLMKLMGS